MNGTLSSKRDDVGSSLSLLLALLSGSNNNDACCGSGCLPNRGNGDVANQHQQSRSWRSKTEFVPLDGEEDVGKVLSRDLYEMTLEERERIMHDVHGVADIADETTEMIRFTMGQLKEELGRIGHRSVAYRKALAQSANYVDSLYLMFLRRDNFDAQKAAARMLGHFDLKLTLWGEDKLGRDVTLDDFSKHDMACLKDGCFQVLPSRDRAGRTMYCNVCYHQKYHERENLVRFLVEVLCFWLWSCSLMVINGCPLFLVAYNLVPEDERCSG
jgi:hypothetical protein